MIRVLNLDGSLLEQKELLEKFRPKVVNLKDIGPLARLWMNQTTAEDIRATLAPESKSDITFLGSGDFHHISSLLIEQFTQPLTVIVFDHHPDCDILPPKLGCGSWVTRILKQSNIKKVIEIGPSSKDLSSPAIYTANIHALKQGRLKIYTVDHSSTNLFGSKTIIWKKLCDKSTQENIEMIKSSIPTKQIYISIDKDCLSKESALTNWEEGKLKLGEFLEILKFLKQNFEIVGADITGEYSESNVCGVLKGFFARLDHPKDYSAKDVLLDTVNRVNEKTNLAILETLL